MNKTTPHNVLDLWDATSFYDSKGQRVPLTNAQSSLMNLFAGIEVHKEPYESLQCRRILGGRKLLVSARTIVTTIFVMTEED